MHIKLPLKKHIYQTSPRDPVRDYYLPVIGMFFRQKLEHTIRLAKGKKYNRLLEIGYGSGILFPTLSMLCDKLYGLETHNNESLVATMMAKEGVIAELKSGSIFDIPFEDNFFDGIICLSLLEHLSPEELPKALEEINRVSGENAVIILGFPTKSVITKNLFKILYHDDHEDIHLSTHRDILKSINKILDIKQVLRFPINVPLDFSLYVNCKCHPKKDSISQ